MTIISVFVSSPDTHSERRLDSTLSVAELKDKLVPITGIAPQYQRLRLYSTTEASPVLAELADDNRTLASYGVQEFQNIRIDNLDPNAQPGEFSNEEVVDRFELTQDEYEQRRDTVLAYKKANKIGRFADGAASASPSRSVPDGEAMSDDVVLGARCEVKGEDGDAAMRGAVRFVGEAHMGQGGSWVGVELDEPLGKGDGSIEGKRYFSCRPKHGLFVRPQRIQVGDFAEEDLLADDDDL